VDTSVTLIYLIVVVAIIASLWTVFTKAGEPGWAAIVPFYNVLVMTKIAGTGPLWFVLTFIPFINIAALFVNSIAMARSFGKGTGFGIGLALLGFVFYPLLAWGDATYVEPAGIS
jgi:hypothetical protein